MADPNERSQLNANSLSESKLALAKLFNTLFNVTYFKSSGDILVNLHNVFSNVVWYRTISWFYLGLSIASVCVGGLYLNLCTVAHMIPIYLIVAGSVGIATNLIFMCKWATGNWSVWMECKDQSESCRSFWFSWTLWILFWFNFAWFIAGSAWIFGVHTEYHDNYDYEPDTHLYVVRHMHIGRYLEHRGRYHGKRGEVAAGGNVHANAFAHLNIAGDDNDEKMAAAAAADTDGARSDARNSDRAAPRTVGAEDRDRDAARGEERMSDAQVVVRNRASGRDVFADVASAGDDVIGAGDGVGFAAASGSAARRRKGMPRKPYCHRGLYEYAFWVSIAHWIMLLLDVTVFMMLSCCYCCAYLVVPYPSSASFVEPQ